MLKIEHVVVPNGEQMLFVIEGMRNSFNSWDKSDSYYVVEGDYVDIFGNTGPAKYIDANDFHLGDADEKLMRNLAESGSSHRKFMRMMPVMVRVTAPLYWWKEFDTYKVGTVRNSCSTMHKIQEKKFTLDDFSCEHLYDSKNLYDSELDCLRNTIMFLNEDRQTYLNAELGDNKDMWWQMIQLLPSSYNQTANLFLNYEVLRTIYHERRYHKLDEWIIFCEWIETLPYSELIVDTKRKG